MALYAVEAGRRLHFWPAPHEDTPLLLHYQRPMALALVPTDLEPVIVHGVLGRYGRHWDRDALTQDPASFEQRYVQELVNAGRDSWDATLISVPEDVTLLYRALAGQAGSVVSGVVALP
jgi:hypothetical protein